MRSLLVVALLALPAAPNAAERRFVTETNPFVLGQAMDWLDRDHVVWHEAVGRDEDADGQVNVYRSRLDDTEKSCLTCGLDGPNQVPVVQPRGDWILFHSWNGHAVRIGGAGFGGLGSDVWVMRRDGTQRTNLTTSPEWHDNFHAYWSPNGKFIAWTALNWDPNDPAANGKSDIRVARFDPSGPRLVDAHVIKDALQEAQAELTQLQEEGAARGRLNETNRTLRERVSTRISNLKRQLREIVARSQRVANAGGLASKAMCLMQAPELIDLYLRADENGMSMMEQAQADEDEQIKAGTHTFVYMLGPFVIVKDINDPFWSGPI